MSQEKLQDALAATPLPLRQDDPISMIFVIKTLLIMGLLLLAVYFGLRWYARRGQLQVPSSEASVATLTCLRSHRLSTRTRLYLVDADGQRLLITESGATVCVTRLTDQGEAP